MIRRHDKDFLKTARSDGLGQSPGLTRHAFARRSFLLAVAATSFGLEQKAHAEALSVPARVQAELVVKVAAYDRNLADRAQGRVLTSVLVRPGDTDSVRGGARVATELQSYASIAGISHSVELLTFTSIDKAVMECKKRRTSILYFAPGLAAEITAFALALQGLDLLTVGAIDNYVAAGAVLGFAVRSGRPKLIINWPQAKLQHVAFTPELLQLAEVIK